MTGAAAHPVASGRKPSTPAHAVAPHFMKHGVGATEPSATRVFSTVSVRFATGAGADGPVGALEAAHVAPFSGRHGLPSLSTISA